MGTRRFPGRDTEADAQGSDVAIDALRPLGTPLDGSRALDRLIERVGDARYVLLGEATHGTHEFYEWRDAISRRLIAEKGFSFVAVEGDWPDCARVNRFVKGDPEAGTDAGNVLEGFDRWPTWMWANREVATFVTWLRAHNEKLTPNSRVGFYGIDVYSLWDSMREVVGYLDRVDPRAARDARRAYECFAPYGESIEDYARLTALVPKSCENDVIKALAALRGRLTTQGRTDREAFFEAEQNAIVAKNAEHYYRMMIRRGPESWNIRDSHMVETLERLMAFHGPDAKVIVWEHNTHVGDARYTDMAEAGEINVGQLVRERHLGDGVVIVGFATHRGEVIAGDEWGEPMRIMGVPPARENSYEDLMHRAWGGRDALVVFPPNMVTPALAEPRGHRAIGVVYRAAFDAYGNYVPTILPRRYDALIYVDQSRAIEPLHLRKRRTDEVPETYPSGV